MKKMTVNEQMTNLKWQAAICGVMIHNMDIVRLLDVLRENPYENPKFVKGCKGNPHRMEIGMCYYPLRYTPV